MCRFTVNALTSLDVMFLHIISIILDVFHVWIHFICIFFSDFSPEWNFFRRLFKRVISLDIMGAQLRTSLKLIGTIPPWCSRGFKEGLIEPPWCRGTPASRKPDRCSDSSQDLSELIWIAFCWVKIYMDCFLFIFNGDILFEFIVIFIYF